MITVSTDGSCLRNPGGAIGWAWANHDGTSASGGATSGTNQIAELTAVLEAIRAHPGPEPLRIEADSQYAIKCSSEWVHNWRRRGWRTASGGPVQNLALVQAIDRAISERTGPVTFSWVRGHRGDRFNERADELAGIAARAARSGTLPTPTPSPATTLPPAPTRAPSPPVLDPAVAPAVTTETLSNPGLARTTAADPVVAPAVRADTRSNPGLDMDPLF
ncbi:ribonuclease H family protein [Cellulomonas palmilytica]|uniref:ribonuclease H family protein n=1 Tax=Cellulomonas palmilytica TaxID=2608402 RepID=UPI001F3657DE|nr:ribonuclease H [Cellulomonas palmilytica]